MQRNLIYDYCKDAEDGGISIWHFMKGRKRPLFLTSTLESTPNFDSNSAYAVILQKNNYSVLNDKGFNSYKIFFWVGSRCEDYEKNYQDTVLFINDIQKTIPCAKTRFFIEFQYTESFEFFSLFKRQDLGIERANEISAIQYQDMYRASGMTKSAIPFPKILIIELINYPIEYQKYNIRIYEKRQLDAKIQSSMIYLYLTGVYLTPSGQQLDEKLASVTSREEIAQKIQSIDVLYGSRVNFTLRQFAKKMVDNFKRTNEDLIITETKQKGESIAGTWQELEEKAMFLNSEVDMTWPCENRQYEAEKYPYPYQITNWDWKVKDKDANDQLKDSDNVIYDIQNEYDINMKKQDVEFDPNNVELFRVSLISKDNKAKPNLRGNVQDIETISFQDKYQISFQQLQLKTTDSSMLSQNQIYIVSTPLTLFLWVGNQVHVSKRKGTLHILKLFLTTKLFEQINYSPSYIDQNQNTHTSKMRVEHQFYESQRFKSFFSKAWTEDKIDYLMMRTPKQDNNNEVIDGGFIEEMKVGMPEDFDMLAELNAQNNGRQTIDDTKRQTFIKEQAQTCSLLKSKTLQSDKETSKEWINAKESTISTQLQNRYDQERFLKNIESHFKPLSILSKPSAQEESRKSKVQLEFDQVVVFEMNGAKWEPILDIYEQGIMDSSKVYLIIFTQNAAEYSRRYKSKHAVYLWRGVDQTSLNLPKAMNRLQETELKQVKCSDAQLQKHAKRNSVMPSNFSMNQLARRESGPESKDTDASKVSDHKTDDHLLSKKPKTILTPSTTSQLSTQEKMDHTKVENMKALLDDNTTVINMRCIVAQDNEPMHMLQAFQGTFVIQTNDYLKRNQLQDLNACQSSVMLFQLIGIPTLNQKAREIQPFYDQLTTSGLYVMLSKQEIFYWIGYEYYSAYLDQETYNKQDQLISGALLEKLQIVYQRTQDQAMEQNKICFCIEGKEEKHFFAVLGGKETESDDEEEHDVAGGEGAQSVFFNRLSLKYESKFIKQMALPQEPRLFCLIYNSYVVEYDDEEQGTQDKEAVVFKELYNFNQKSLDEKGVFLMDFSSEAFVWVGKKVAEKDRLFIPQLAYQTLSTVRQSKDFLEKVSITQVDSGFEPDIFKESFKEGWQNYEHVLNTEIAESDEEYDSNDSEEEAKVSETKIEKKKTIVLSKPNIIPENFWIN